MHFSQLSATYVFFTVGPGANWPGSFRSFQMHLPYSCYRFQAQFFRNLTLSLSLAFLNLN